MIKIFNLVIRTKKEESKYNMDIFDMFNKELSVILKKEEKIILLEKMVKEKNWQIAEFTNLCRKYGLQEEMVDIIHAEEIVNNIDYFKKF